MMVPQGRPHEKISRRFPLADITEEFKIIAPDTEEGWRELGRWKKRDLNDIVHEINPRGILPVGEVRSRMLQFLEDTPTINCGGQPGMIVSANELMELYPEKREPVIDGLLRRGESLNVIGAPKTNKSWFALNIAMSMVTGGMLFGKFECRKKGRVLIVDNELHCELIADRVKVVSDAMNIPRFIAGSMIDYVPLRGRLTDLDKLQTILQNIRPGLYSIVILDAFYKFYPPDFDENSNAAMANLYNKLDFYAECLDSSLILIHHASKGSQAGRSVTDVGAGAGSQSRACDAHMVIRQHETPGTYVFDVANRSFPPIESFCCKFRYPVWVEDSNADPAMLAGLAQKKGVAAGPRPGASQEETDKWRSGENARIDKFIAENITKPTSIPIILSLGTDRGFRHWNRDKMKTLIPRLIDEKKLVQVAASHGKTPATYISTTQVPAAAPDNTHNNANVESLNQEYPNTEEAENEEYCDFQEN